MVNTKIWRYRENKEGYRTPARVGLWVSPAKKQRAGSIPPALKQQAIDESVPYTDIIEANKQK